MANPIQPGDGYGFSTAGGSFNLNINQPWQDDTSEGVFFQFPTIPPVDPLDPDDPYANDWTIFINKLVDHPWKVVNQPGSTGCKITPGTVNNLDPWIVDGSKKMTYLPRETLTYVTDGSGYCYIYLQMGYDSTNKVYPALVDTDDHYPIVIASDTQLVSDDEYGYVLLATVKVDGSNATVWQYVKQSIWAARTKIGSDDAQYYYAGF